MYPPQKTRTTSRKKITPHRLKVLEHPDKKLNSLEIILIPWENLKPLDKYQPSPTPKKNPNLQEKTSLLVKVSTTLKKPQPQ